MNDYITSFSNQTIKHIRSLYEKKGRDTSGAFVIEGRKCVEEIPFGWETELFLVSRAFAEASGVSAYAGRAKVLYAEDAVFNRIADTVAPQGILAVCRQKRFGRAELERLAAKDAPLFILLEEINDPGNLGAIIRAADAAGADGIILSKGCADVYGPKTLRSAAGSIFHLPFLQDADIIEWIGTLRAANLCVYAAHLRGGVYPYGLDFRKGCAFVIGNEARGLSDEAASACCSRVKIPIIGGAESLNAAVACGILIYEAVRQRIEGDGGKDG